MADINVQMPSENEDYDVTTAAAGSPPNPPVAVSNDTPDFSKPVETFAPTAPTPTPAAVSPAVVADDVAPPAEQPAAAPEATATVSKRALPVWPIVTGVLALAVVALSVFSFTLAGQKNDAQAALRKANANPQLLVQKQTDNLISKVGALMTLPSGETPTVANVSDAAKAKQQSAFFAKAENGDRVLMYVKAGQAILYRPSTDKIILVAPLTFNNDAAATGAAPTTTKK